MSSRSSSEAYLKDGGKDTYSHVGLLSVSTSSNCTFIIISTGVISENKNENALAAPRSATNAYFCAAHVLQGHPVLFNCSRDNLQHVPNNSIVKCNIQKPQTASLSSRRAGDA